MKLSKLCKPELCVSDDKNRYAIALPYLRGSQLLATDGKKLVIIPIELSDGDTDGYISSEALKLSRKSKRSPSEVFCAEKALIPSIPDAPTLVRPNQSNSTYPTVSAVDPTVNGEQYKAYRPTVAINARFLWELAQAMGTENVVLELAYDAPDPESGTLSKVDHKKPLIIRPGLIGQLDTFRGPVGAPKAYGILMPHTLPDAEGSK